MQKLKIIMHRAISSLKSNLLSEEIFSGSIVKSFVLYLCGVFLYEAQTANINAMRPRMKQFLEYMVNGFNRHVLNGWFYETKLERKMFSITEQWYIDSSHYC